NLRVSQRERHPELALPLRAIAGTWRDHHARALEHELGELLGGISPRHAAPDIQARLGPGRVDADLAEGLAQPVAPVLVNLVAGRYPRLVAGQGRDGRVLDGPVYAGVNVGLDAPQHVNDLAVAHGHAD